MAKTVLITGATGTVGRDIAKQLSRKGPVVRAGVRDQVKARKRFGVEIDPVTFDFQDAGSFGGALEFRVAHSSRMSVKASRFHELPLQDRCRSTNRSSQREVSS